MTLSRGAVYLVLITGLVGLLVVNIISQRSLDKALADRADLETQLQKTVQKQTEAQVGLSNALQKAQVRITELEGRSEKFAGLAQRLTTERDQLTSGQQALTAERDRLTSEQQTLTAERDRLINQHRTLTEELATLRKSAAAKEVDGRKLEETLAGLKSLLDEIQSKVAGSEQALLERLAKLENPAPAGPTSPASAPVTKVPANSIDTVVAAVSEADGVVVLGVGTVKGVTKGTVFSIYRETENIATVRAVNVQPDYVGCVIDTAAEPIRKGYRASTK